MDYGYWIRWAWQHVSDWWPFKLTVGTFLALCHMHMALITLFALVVALDLLAKWLALSYRYLGKIGIRKRDLWSCFLAIPEAQRAGLISSDLMKRLFCGKMLVYLVLILGAGLSDEMLRLVGADSILVPLCVGYLATSELISIVENLKDAGVDVLAELVTKLEKRR